MIRIITTVDNKAFSSRVVKDGDDVVVVGENTEVYYNEGDTLPTEDIPFGTFAFNVDTFEVAVRNSDGWTIKHTDGTLETIKEMKLFYDELYFDKSASRVNVGDKYDYKTFTSGKTYQVVYNGRAYTCRAYEESLLWDGMTFAPSLVVGNYTLRPIEDGESYTYDENLDENYNSFPFYFLVSENPEYISAYFEGESASFVIYE